MTKKPERMNTDKHAIEVATAAAAEDSSNNAHAPIERNSIQLTKYKRDIEIETRVFV